MFSFLVATCTLIVYVNAQDVVNPASSIFLQKLINQNDGSGNYHFEYACSDGQQREETGALTKLSADEDAWIAVTGFYSYIGTDGKNYTVKYRADKGGYQPEYTIDGQSASSSFNMYHQTGSSSLNYNQAPYQLPDPSGVSQGSPAVADTNIKEQENSTPLHNESYLTTESTVNESNTYLPPPPEPEASGYDYTTPNRRFERLVPDAAEINSMAHIDGDNSSSTNKKTKKSVVKRNNYDNIADSDLINYILAYRS